MRPLLEPRPHPPPLHSPAQTARHFQDSDGGAWANNSPCDFTDRRLGQEWFHPQGDTEPLVWDQQRTRRAQTPPQTFLRPSPTSENRLSRHHQQQQGPPPPPALPYRAPQRHGDPQAGLSLSNPGPLAPGSGSVFLARAHPHTHTPLICAPFHLLFHTVKKLFSLNSYPCPGLDGGTEVANHPRKKPAHSAVPTQKPLLGRHELCSPSGPWEQGHLALAPPPDLR